MDAQACLNLNHLPVISTLFTWAGSKILFPLSEGRLRYLKLNCLLMPALYYWPVVYGRYEGCLGSLWNLVIKCSNIDIILF